MATSSIRLACAGSAYNRLLGTLPSDDLTLLRPHLETADFARGNVLFRPGDTMDRIFFPCDGCMISLAVLMPGEEAAEACFIGNEGALGGWANSTQLPAFTRGVVQMSGPCIFLSAKQLEATTTKSTTLRDVFSRYADCLLAQLLQQIACNRLHNLEQRIGRTLMAIQDIVGTNELPLTQEYLAEILGVQRTTVTSAAASLQMRGVISYRRGRIRIVDREALAALACPCHRRVVEHYKTRKMELRAARPRMALGQGSQNASKLMPM